MKKGDLIKVKDPGCVYSTYEGWMDKNASDYKIIWEREYGGGMYKPLKKEEVAVFLKKAPHEDFKEWTVALIFIRDHVVMIGTEGIEPYKA